MRSYDFNKNKPIEKKSQNRIKEILLSTCVLFSIFSLVVLATQLFGSNDLIHPLRFFMLFPFALCISLANLLLKVRSVNTFFKLVLHFAAISASLYLCIFTVIDNENPLALIFVLGVVYIIIAVPTVIILKRKNKKSEPKTEYVSMFKGVTK